MSLAINAFGTELGKQITNEGAFTSAEVLDRAGAHFYSQPDVSNGYDYEAPAKKVGFEPVTP